MPRRLLILAIWGFCAAGSMFASTRTPAAPASASSPATPILDVLLLRDYNTRLVVLSTLILGASSGLIGSFLLLRRRSLMGDALSHATLPGIALAFLIAVHLGWNARSLPLLLGGAALSGLAGVGTVMFIRRHSRIRNDAAMGIVLSTYFGLGVALLGVIQKLPTGNQAGLQSFIYGKTASMVWSDFLLIAGSAGICGAVCLLLVKELELLCFDEGFAASQGWPTGRLDAVLMGAVTLVTVVGLQAVGLILIIALLIIPAAAARFWTERVRGLMFYSAVFGALSGWTGASASALLEKLPAGAVIVLAAGAVFAFSMIFGSERGALWSHLDRLKVQRRVGRQHLLRVFYELHEKQARSSVASAPGHPGNPRADFARLLQARSWSPGHLRSLLRRAERDGLIKPTTGDCHELTDAGLRAARQTVRNHRLWELYLLTHADRAPGRVDHGADRIEHVLGEALVAELEKLLDAEDRHVPLSPHQL